jgi:hypothetical protein
VREAIFWSLMDFGGSSRSCSTRSRVAIFGAEPSLQPFISCRNH